MLRSALVQEAVSRGVSFVLGWREEKASQGHLKERLEMAANELELALERSAKLPITDVSLLQRRKMIKRGYVEAMELLKKDKQQAVPPGQELQVAQGVKRKRWFDCAKNMSLKPFVALSTDAVKRFEWYADHAGRFVRDVESGCSLHHNTFCNPIVRHLLEGKTFWYDLKQGNVQRKVRIFPMYFDERGVEAQLVYSYMDSTMIEKCFNLVLSLRLSESTDIVGVAIKGLQLLTAEFKHPVECAMGELTLLRNLQDTADLSGTPLVRCCEVIYTMQTQLLRPDPTCCKGLCANNNNVSSELSDILPEQVILWGFDCYIPALESSTRSSFDEVGRGTLRFASSRPPSPAGACTEAPQRGLEGPGRRRCSAAWGPPTAAATPPAPLGVREVAKAPLKAMDLATEMTSSAASSEVSGLLNWKDS
ncbi:unnamed protein product [Miscanthus lutarioriparius]|uniref:Uncharacterized protein n=1 Tax=Miscanthus lutarioriparius TaxID=422564 RepID=A0A811NGL8_9POAL|nr:unnamed protein product [Miscanthus lutarioriparius]